MHFPNKMNNITTLHMFKHMFFNPNGLIIKHHGDFGLISFGGLVPLRVAYYDRRHNSKCLAAIAEIILVELDLFVI